jgi:Rrf2 family protein
MKLAFGSRGEYALRAMLDLASHASEGRRRTRTIAAATDVPSHYLARILASLAAAGVLDARPGPHGGYALARAPAEISLLEIVEAVEKPTGPYACALRGGDCNLAAPCAFHATWDRIRAQVDTEMRGVTLGDLAGDVDGARPVRRRGTQTTRGRRARTARGRRGA